MTNPSRSLSICADEVQHYFRAMGGSNQYSKFMNWHIPAFVLLVAFNKVESEILPYGAWENTEELQKSTKARLNLSPPSQKDIAEFVASIKTQVTRFKDKREEDEWLEFCDALGV